MRKFGGLTVFIVLVAAAAVAQIPTSGNIFVGYSYSRTNSVPGNTLSLNGWEGSLEGKFLPWIGIVADFEHRVFHRLGEIHVDPQFRGDAGLMMLEAAVAKAVAAGEAAIVLTGATG